MIKNYFSFVLITIVSFFAVSIQANELSIEIKAADAYVRASIPGTEITSAYMTIVNNSEKTVTLTKVSSKISPQIEIHQNIMINDMMKMQKLESVKIKGNESLVLQPSGLHLMLFKLTHALKPNEVVELALHFSDEQVKVVQLPVKSLKQKQQHHHHH
ncbi:copper chaperone PCu(A)C [Litorilituus lipolyticus]|uniref:Copper chaperone PCu(A)C n=1 Tax=Litorilituus lipolyticus TaxID=2491017 RepID=A0A502L1D5_9GAMM|nr:copper chaperone PCu(A)C [Litorilituus lipolyticus]TPH16111.1 copper chaperone PCu(A)C [Litorilituus lipolyticus]